ncbi:pilus assembly protein [Aliivibrio fischeri]|uniref:pilus assembly protein n=1 Tax=Aliivibrio fischeri TaxID=668 RepID=UPI00080E601A|nr:pilus assembly protein [Aliivibrio fischeri]OCH48155.1 pilus assembly protein [Aliivibrio fischeri]
MFKKMLSFIIFFTSFQSHAIAVSSLFESADPDTHSADVIIANNDGKDMFINLEMAKVEYIDGKKVVTKVSRESLKDWTFSISPSQLILKDGEKKAIRLHNNCEKYNCKLDKDQVYAVDVTPVPYTDGKISAVAVSFGYRVYFMDPATDVKLKYDIKRVNDKEFKFSNQSNTMLNAVINTCSKNFSDDCIYQYKLLSGSEKTFSLPEEVINKSSIILNIINSNEVINEQVSI